MFRTITLTIFFDLFAMFRVVSFPPFADFVAMFGVIAETTFVSAALVAEFAVAVPVESFAALLADHDATCTRHHIAMVAPMAHPPIKPPAR